MNQLQAPLTRPDRPTASSHELRTITEADHRRWLDIVTTVTLALVYLFGIVCIAVSVKIGITPVRIYNQPDERKFAWLGVGGVLASIMVTGLLASVVHYIKLRSRDS